MGVTYPLDVQYCQNCSLPMEYCEYYPGRTLCTSWLSNRRPVQDEEPTTKKRGGKKSPQKPGVYLSWTPRGKRKSVTVVTGLSFFGVDLKTASRYFGLNLATGTSVTGNDEIVVQGDAKEKIRQLITVRWPSIPPEQIEDLGYLRR